MGGDPSADLRKILVEETGRDDEAISNAVDRVKDAVEYYCATRPGIVEIKSGRRVARKPSETRDKLLAIDRALATFLAAWDDLDGVGRQLIGQNMPPDEGQQPAPIGYLHIERLRQLTAAVRKARADAQDLPNKETNFARGQLATEVAIVFRDLGLTPSSVRHDITGVSGGAYSHALCAALAMAGEYAADWEGMIRAGLKGLNDQDLPHNSPT
jgi:hypothetical protein